MKTSKEDYVQHEIDGEGRASRPFGVFYLFPTNDDVNYFSKSRFKPLAFDSTERVNIGKIWK